MDKNCLGYAEIDTKNPQRNELKYIETKKDLSYKNQSRKTKYIGETIVSFLLGLTKKSPQKDFVVPHTLCSAEGFYIDKCGFKHYEKGSVVSTYKPKEEFDDLIFQNEKHTGSKIEFLI